MIQAGTTRVKQVDVNVIKLRKQHEHARVTLDRQILFLNHLCKNQRKLAKSLSRRKVKK